MLLEVNCFQTQYVYCEGTILPLHYYPTIIVSRYPAAGKYFQNTTYPAVWNYSRISTEKLIQSSI